MSTQYPLPLPHQVAMDAADFMVTPSNQEAVKWLDKWPAWPAHCLNIYGPPGSGKSHLAQVWQGRSNAQAITISQLTAENSESLVTNISTIVFDNADKIAGDPKAEEALFHLYNNLRDNKGFLLLTSVAAPAQWSIKLPDLRSRLLSIPAVAIAAPDDELVLALLIKQFRDRQIDVGAGVVDYLLTRITRTPGAIRDIVTRLDSASLAEGRGITIALARRLLEDQSFPIS